MCNKRKISYEFVPLGSIVNKDSKDTVLRPAKNKIFIDIGNSLEKCIKDLEAIFS
jgi:hypothetical protein